MIGQKVIGGIQHKIEKDKIIKAKEIEAYKNCKRRTNKKASTTSWKDEYLVVIFGLVFVANFVPHLQDYMERGWQILKVLTHSLVRNVSFNIRKFWYELN